MVVDGAGAGAGVEAGFVVGADHVGFGFGFGAAAVV